jgi:hypothetical protein
MGEITLKKFAVNSGRNNEIYKHFNMHFTTGYLLFLPLYAVYACTVNCMNIIILKA